MKITIKNTQKNAIKKSIIEAVSIGLSLEKIAQDYRDYWLENRTIDLFNDLFAENGENLKSKDEAGNKDPRYQKIEYIKRLAKGSQKEQKQDKPKSIDDIAIMLVNVLKFAEKHSIPMDQVKSQFESIAKRIK